VPVVSTPSQGGRHVWYNDYNSIICDSTEDAVAEAVEELVRHPRDSQCIRQMHIEQAEEYRRKFIDVLAEVFNRFGVTDVEPDVYFRENFFHKLRKSYKPDFQAIFPSENQRVFAPAMYSVNPNVLSKYKDQYRGGMSEWRLLTGKSKANHILSLCSANKIAPSSLIEVGCGEGAILENLNDQNFCENMYAIDISESGIRVILSRELKNLKEAKVFDGYHIPYPDQSFDLAICSHVLEHVEYERILLREIARVSKRFIIEVPIDYRPGADAIANHFFAYGHINMYTPTTLRFLLKSEGFSIIDDIVDITDPEASCYNYFFNQRKEEPTQDNIKAQLDRLAAEVEKFKKKTRMQQEESASDYTVLVDSMTKGIKIF
ncbi:class I SAM-dependent methyltransferase, partial [Limnospira platensis]